MIFNVDRLSALVELGVFGNLDSALVVTKDRNQTNDFTGNLK